MKKDECKKQKRTPTRNTLITIRATTELSKWLHEEQLSPTAIFRTACKELGYKGAL